MFYQIRKKIALKIAVVIVFVVMLVSIASILYFNSINKKNLTESINISLSNAINFSEQVYARPLWDFNDKEIDRLNRIILNNKLIVAVNLFDIETFMNGTKKKESSLKKNTILLENIRNSLFSWLKPSTTTFQYSDHTTTDQYSDHTITGQYSDHTTIQHSDNNLTTTPHSDNSATSPSVSRTRPYKNSSPANKKNSQQSNITTTDEVFENNLEKIYKPYKIPEDEPYIKKISGDIILEENVIGHFELFYTEEFINNAVAMANKRMILAFMVIAGIIIITIIISVSKINRPIVVLAELAEKIAKENSYEIEIKKSNRIDEVGTLVNSFAEMMEQIKKKERERNSLYESLQENLTLFRSLFSKLQHAIDNEDYSMRISHDSDNDELAISLNKIMEALESADTTKQNQSWLKNGQAELGGLISREQNIDVLCRKALEFIAGYVGAMVGTLFVKDDIFKGFKLIATYAFKTRKGVANRFKAGEGLTGQAALEKKSIIFTEIPEDYIHIESSIGNSVPKSIIVLPIIYEDDVKGVMELGITTFFSEIQIEFLETVTEIIAIAINGAMFNEKLSVLLEQTREQAEELKAQQEELKATNEELEEQTMILKESEEKLQVQQEELQASNEEMEEKTELLQIQKREIQKSNEALKQKQIEIKEKAKQLELETRYKSEFLANMSHELRTPLNSLLILANMLAENEEENLTQDQIDSAASIYRSGQNLLHLINDILDLSKIEAKKIELNISSFPLKDLGEHCKTEFVHMAKEKGLEFIVVSDDNLPEMITSDMYRLEQILRNLIGNAIKFTDNGQITLHFSRPGSDSTNPPSVRTSLEPSSAIAISIKDSGVGIPEDQLNTIFEAFKQVDGSIRRRHDGTGLGLSISRELACLLGGEIQVKSKFAQGSIFTIYIPEKVSSEASLSNHSLPNAQIPPGNVNKNYLNDKGYKTPEFSLNEKYPEKSSSEKNYTDDRATHDKFITQKDQNISFDNTKERFTQHDMDEKKRNISGNHTENGATDHKVNTEFRKSSDNNNFNEYRDIEKSTHSSDPTTSDRPEKTILIIEDDPEFAKVLSIFFQKHGYHSIACHTGEEGLKHVIDHKPTAIILDIMLPGIDGWAVMNELKSNPDTRHIPVHIMSGHDNTQKGLEKGAVGYLTKPVSSEDLGNALKKIEHVVLNDVKNLLVVEDNQELQLSILKLIGTNDIRVTAAVTGKEAISLLKKENFDGMILDLGLPDISGFDILDQISKDPSIEMIPVIVFTGRDLTSTETARLEKYSSSIVLKNAVSMERLIDETALFLHRVESDMPEKQKKIIKNLREQQNILFRKKVMIVDDDMRNAFALNKYLKSRGLDVTIANNGEKALKILETEEPPEIILMDIMMPVMDGYEAIRRIRKIKTLKDIPIIALTAKAMSSDRDECIRCGANDYLSKPLDTSKLLTLLRVWLSR
ncbi:putative Sensor histidine kinase with ATPase domain [Desulfamplus magnetovallimortis]|uniref:histidine kinase n=1 Tax=Desulfamplus magnetovallimortis TaxID=1246637 RepID=A0A1W1H7G5_9BACT|nr:response regulator [Desulfamplus magnetovallimortis]SLM28318.1 putative Sensor histidine kinase with ATPase domain [Desulfamplus magnetovallimortis]